MNVALWIVQLMMGIFFISVGVLHFLVPEGLPAAMSWMYDLSPTQHLIAGTAEILGGAGLILPGVIRILPQVVPLAALGLATIMILAIVFHAGRGEYQNIATNVVDILFCAFIAWGRFTHPIAPRRQLV